MGGLQSGGLAFVGSLFLPVEMLCILWVTGSSVFLKALTSCLHSTH